MNDQNSLKPKSKKGLIIGVAVAVLLLLLIIIFAVIGGVIYWHWTTQVNS